MDWAWSPPSRDRRRIRRETDFGLAGVSREQNYSQSSPHGAPNVDTKTAGNNALSGYIGDRLAAVARFNGGGIP